MRIGRRVHRPPCVGVCIGRRVRRPPCSHTPRAPRHPHTPAHAPHAPHAQTRWPVHSARASTRPGLHLPLHTPRHPSHPSVHVDVPPVQVSTPLDGRRMHVVCPGGRRSVSHPEMERRALALLPARPPSPVSSARDSSCDSEIRSSREVSLRADEGAADGVPKRASGAADGVPKRASGAAAEGEGRGGAAHGAGEPHLPNVASLAEDPVRLILLQLEMPRKAMQRVAAEARRRGCTVALRASPLPPPLPTGVRPYQATAEALLQEHVDILFINEWDAPARPPRTPRVTPPLVHTPRVPSRSHPSPPVPQMGRAVAARVGAPPRAAANGRARGPGRRAAAASLAAS